MFTLSGGISPVVSFLQIKDTKHKIRSSLALASKFLPDSFLCLFLNIHFVLRKEDIQN